MRKVIAVPFLSLDGFIAGPQGEGNRGVRGNEFDRERLPHLLQLDRIEHQSRHEGYEHE